MPMQSHSGVRGVPWAYCDLCGWQYPLDKLRMQDGLLKCAKDYDDPQKVVGVRDQLVAEFLANAEPEAQNETAKTRSEPNNTLENL